MEIGKLQDERQKNEQSILDDVDTSINGGDNLEEIIEEDEDESSNNNDDAMTIRRRSLSPLDRPQDEGIAKLLKEHGKLAKTVLKSVACNPVVFMTVLGIAGNFFFKYILFTTGLLEVCIFF